MTTPTPDDLSVIIPTRDRWDILARTLGALRDQTVAGFEIVVVADGSDQDPPADLPADRVLPKPHAGPAAARNHGLAATDRPLVLFLGDDMIPDPGLVAAHLSRHAAEPAATTAVLGHVDWHENVAGSRLLRWLDWSTTQFDYVQLEGCAGRDVGFGRFYSCNVSLKRGLLESVGGFDEDFLYYYEDLDLGWRLAQEGLRLVYVPAARARHLHDYTMEDIRRRFEGIALGERLMAAKHSWFDPYFHGAVADAARRRPASRLWTRLVDLVPRGSRVRRRVERRAHTWYLQQVADDFLTAWDRAGEAVELRRYLGDDFCARLLAHHDEAVAREVAAADDEIAFYRTSTSYLYDLTAFAMSGTKDPYRTALREHVPADARLLDYGCGIGSDGLRLLENGYEVAFADFDNPSTRYLRWRLDRRGVEAPVYDIETDDIPAGFDAAYAFDVVEHVDDPVALLRRLESRAGLIVVNLLEDDPGHHEHALHRRLPIDRIVARARDRGLVEHSIHHDRSHLLVYAGDGTTGRRS